MVLIFRKFSQREHDAIKRLVRIRGRDPDLPPRSTNIRIEPGVAKIYVSGTTVETYEFAKPVYYRGEGESGWWGGRTIVKSNRSEEHRLHTTNRARNKLRRLINTNFDSSKAKFVTLTFSPRKIVHTKDARTFDFRRYKEIDFTSPSACKKLWRLFMKRMRLEYQNFKWAVVMEFQERGVVHYHMVLDIPDLKHSDKFSIDMWGHGFALITDITCVDNVGSYVTSYMTKDFFDVERLEGTKMYETSRGNMDKPTEIAGMQTYNEVFEWHEQKKETLVYEQEYPADFVENIRYREYNIGRFVGEVKKSADLVKELRGRLESLY